jgi:hypothetical protein
MKKLVAIILVIAATGAVAGYSLAAATGAGSQTYKADNQQFQWRKHRITTSSAKFHNLKIASSPGAAQFIVAKGPISATFSGTFKGGPVQVRVVDLQRNFHPGAATFRPGSEASSFSYSFVSHGSAKARCHYVGVEWRALTGAPVTFKSGDLVVDYHQKAPKGDVLTC